MYLYVQSDPSVSMASVPFVCLWTSYAHTSVNIVNIINDFLII